MRLLSDGSVIAEAIMMTTAQAMSGLIAAHGGAPAGAHCLVRHPRGDDRSTTTKIQFRGGRIAVKPGSLSSRQKRLHCAGDGVLFPGTAEPTHNDEAIVRIEDICR